MRHHDEYREAANSIELRDSLSHSASPGQKAPEQLVPRNFCGDRIEWPNSGWKLMAASLTRNRHATESRLRNVNKIFRC